MHTSVFDAEDPKCIGLFAIGRSGNPLRHHSLLQSLAEQGCTVVAPHFDMLASSIPTKAEFDARLQRLEASASGYAHANAPIVGVGQSIGAVTLLALAGG